jgi:hypothetical protein
MKQGYNLGSMHHFAQMRYKNNGYIPDSLIERIKKEVPAEKLEICRVAGVVSNWWAMDLPGYNLPSYELQINNRKDLEQPTISYFYSFLDFYKKVGFKELIWTLNTVSAWANPKERSIWERRMWNMLDAIDREGIKINAFCLENEMWMDARCVVMGNGSLNVFHKIAIAGWKGLFMNDNAIKPLVQKGMREYHQYLEGIAKQIIKRYPDAKIAISIDSPDHLRGKWLTEVTQEFDFYHAVCPHIYITPKNKEELRAEVYKRMAHAHSFGKEIWITEYNWSYGDNDAGQSQGEYHDKYFQDDIVSECKKAGADLALLHCMWADDSSYGELQNK